MLGDLKWNNPAIVAVLPYIPLPSIRHFLEAFERLARVSQVLVITHKP